MATTSLQPGLGISHQNFSKGLKHSRGNKVTWAAGDKLCQVRLFAADDAPCLSGIAHQDFLQIKQSRFMHTATPIAVFDELDLPPGFGHLDIKHMKASTQAFSDIVAGTSWRCPEMYVLNHSWQVATGEDSQEVGIQRQRELGVLEAVYPRVTSIPDSPAEPRGQQQSLELPFDDTQILQIPVVPIEEDDSMDVNDDGDPNADGDSHESVPKGELVSDVVMAYTPQVPNVLRTQAEIISKDAVPVDANSLSSTSTPVVPHTSDFPCLTEQSGGTFSKQFVPGSSQLTSSHGGQIVSTIEPDVVAAAAAAFAAMTKAKEEGSLIDQDLLIQMLSNPVLVETLSGCKPSQNLNSQLRLAISGSHVVLGATDAQVHPNSPSSIKNILTTFNQQTNSTTPIAGISMQTKDVFVKRQNPLQKKLPALQNITQVDSGAFGCGNISTQHLNENKIPLFHPLNSQTYTTIPVELRQPTNHLHPGSASNPNILGRSTHYDEQYYKRLIMQHGGNNTYKTPSLQFDTIPREAEMQRKRSGKSLGDNTSHVIPPKICAYHNTARGCRNGTACMFLHDTTHGATDERSGFDINHSHLKKRARYENLT